MHPISLIVSAALNIRITTQSLSSQSHLILHVCTAERDTNYQHHNTHISAVYTALVCFTSADISHLQ